MEEDTLLPFAFPAAARKKVKQSGEEDCDKGVLAVKGNQGTLRQDVELFAAEQKANGFRDAKIRHHETVDGDHRRIETRSYATNHDVAWLNERHDCLDCIASSWSRAGAKTATKSSARPASTSPRCNA